MNDKLYTYTYDTLGRPSRTDVSDGSWLQYGYNVLDQSTSLRYGYNGARQTVSYAYSSVDNLPASVTFPGSGKVTNTYDGLTRLTGRTYQTPSAVANVTASYAYLDWTSQANRTTTTVQSIDYRYVSGRLEMPDLSYGYDKSGNITSEKELLADGSTSLREKYTYDGKNQLIRHDSVTQNATFTYSYDKAGNITAVKRYAYTTGTPGTAQETRSYAYGESTWGDLLTGYNGKAITYDAMGNMKSCDGKSYTWQGRELTKIQGGGNTYSYKYNAGGIRTAKTVNGTTTEYFLNGTQILAQKTGDEVMWFFYDSTGQRVGLMSNGHVYYYLYNLQGDVVALVRGSTGQVVARYSYDAWGKCTVTNASGYTVGTKNPFRYRGYYHDAETGLYYLNSRYYNPEFGRFISPDVFVSTGQGLTGANMFAYCGNNPVMYADPSGMFAKFAEEIVKVIGELVETVAGPLWYITERTKKGELYEFWVHDDGNPEWSRHHANHGNEKEHPFVPHDHHWHDDGKGKENKTENTKSLPPNPGFQAPESNKQNRDNILPVIGLFGVATIAGFGLAGAFGCFGGSGYSVGISLGGNFSPFTICIMYAQ